MIETSEAEELCAIAGGDNHSKRPNNFRQTVRSRIRNSLKLSSSTSQSEGGDNSSGQNVTKTFEPDSHNTVLREEKKKSKGSRRNSGDCFTS